MFGWAKLKSAPRPSLTPSHHLFPSLAMATATYAHRNPAHAQLRRTPALDTQYNQPFRPPQPPLPPQHRATGAPQPPPKDGAVPPLPRQNSKTVPPSPPRVINDAVKSLTYTRIGFLGEVSAMFIERLIAFNLSTGWLCSSIRGCRRKGPTARHQGGDKEFPQDQEE